MKRMKVKDHYDLRCFRSQYGFPLKWLTLIYLRNTQVFQHYINFLVHNTPLTSTTPPWRVSLRSLVAQHGGQWGRGLVHATQGGGGEASARAPSAAEPTVGPAGHGEEQDGGRYVAHSSAWHVNTPQHDSLLVSLLFYFLALLYLKIILYFLVFINFA